MLLHLGNQFDLLTGFVCRLERKRVVDLRQMGSLELDVENRSDDLNDLSSVISHDVPVYPYSRAAEPPTISAISCVIWA